MIDSPKIGQLVYYVQAVYGGDSWRIFAPLQSIDIRSGVVVNSDEQSVMLETVGWFSRALEVKGKSLVFEQATDIWEKLVN